MQNTSSTKKESASRTYESAQLNEALDEILHPGGLKLTSRVADVAKVNAGSHVLDIASGRGTSACFLARRYGCHVVGVDLSPVSACMACSKAATDAFSSQVDFVVGDAERLPFAHSSFDVVISECAFSLIQDKERGASEVARVLRSGGRLVITDVFLRGQLSDDLKTDLTFGSCFSGAVSVEEYLRLFMEAGLAEPYTEDHSIELKRIAYKLQIGYGSLQAFWEQFGAGAAPCCAGGSTCTGDMVRRLFAEGKPGYALIALRKAWGG